jgi:hypothetical protein
VVADALDGLAVWAADLCTICDSGYNSYRGSGTDHRQVSVAWIPSD